LSPKPGGKRKTADAMFIDQCVSSTIIAKPCVVLMAPANRMASHPFQYRFSEFTIFLLTGFFACTVSLNAGADPVTDRWAAWILDSIQRPRILAAKGTRRTGRGPCGRDHAATLQALVGSRMGEKGVVIGRGEFRDCPFVPDRDRWVKRCPVQGFRA